MTSAWVETVPGLGFAALFWLIQPARNTAMQMNKARTKKICFAFMQRFLTHII
jgi:hypothetical protein